MSTLTAPRQSALHRPHTSILIVSGIIVVMLAAAAVVIPRLGSTSTTTSSAAPVTYSGGGGGNASHSVRGHPGTSTNGLPSVASAVAAGQVVAMQRQYLDRLLFQKSRLVDEGTPKAAASLKALEPRIVGAQQSLAKAQKAAQLAQPRPQPQPHTQN